MKWTEQKIYQTIKKKRINSSITLKNLARKSRKLKVQSRDFPGGAVVKNLPANAADTGSSPGPGRSHMPRSN